MTGPTTAASPWRDRSAAVRETTLTTRMSAKNGTSSAWYWPTGSEIVRSCFQPSATPAMRSTIPCADGRIVANVSLGTATGTPNTRNANTVAPKTMGADQRK